MFEIGERGRVFYGEFGLEIRRGFGRRGFVRESYDLGKFCLEVEKGLGFGWFYFLWWWLCLLFFF